MNDLIKATLERLLSWPVAAVLICLVFRKQLTALFSALTAFVHKAGSLSLKRGDTTLEARTDLNSQLNSDKPTDLPVGVGVALTAGDQTESSGKMSDDRSRLRDFCKVFTTTGLRETVIRKELERFSYLVPTDELTEILIRQIAGQQIITHFEKTYRLIFGSQLRFLRFLNQNGEQPQENVYVAFSAAVDNYPEVYKRFSAEDWLTFLVINSLVIKIDGSENVAMSEAGRDFLIWTLGEGLTWDKPF